MITSTVSADAGNSASPVHTSARNPVGSPPMSASDSGVGSQTEIFSVKGNEALRKFSGLFCVRGFM